MPTTNPESTNPVYFLLGNAIQKKSPTNLRLHLFKLQQEV